MTYCAGILVQDGLVMIADTRTNAGLDDISTFRKLHVFSWPGDRTFGLMTAGNLSVTQSVVSLLHEGLPNPETGESDTLQGVTSMFRAAQLVGRAIRHVRAEDGPALKEAGVKFDVTMLFGGQIRGQPMRLFMIYGAGNFIECGMDAPFLQIGEHKYGKPILDRAITYKTHLYDALKVGLISMDSTMRSNLGVGLPSHRGGRALFPRSARALVGGAARGAHRDPQTALRTQERLRKARADSSTMLRYVNGISRYPCEGSAQLGRPGTSDVVVFRREIDQRRRIRPDAEEFGRDAGLRLCHGGGRGRRGRHGDHRRRQPARGRAAA